MSTLQKETKPETSVANYNYFWLLTTCLSAAAIRYWLMISKYQPVIAGHIEVSTPLNSWKRVSEGLYLLSRNINPYNGDLLHETPLSLYFYRAMIHYFQRLEIMFVIFDIATAITMFFTAKVYLRRMLDDEQARQNEFAVDSKEYLLTISEVDKAPMYALLAYLYNPFLLLNCVGYATTVFHNFFMSVFLCALVHGNVILSSSALAICASVSFYPVVLISPMFLYFYKCHKSLCKATTSVVLFILVILLTVVISSDYGNDFSYLRNVYGFILSVPDLKPNIGLFWYFFTEMFDHFRDLFTYSFQINATILYLIPLSIKFRNSPLLLTMALLFLTAIFKSYPTVGDVGFAISMLPCFIYLGRFCQQGFLVSTVVLLTTCLAPILWYLWIYCNSANANFYFGVTLAYAIALIFLCTDFLFAHVKRDYCIKHGKDRKINGEEAVLLLQ